MGSVVMRSFCSTICLMSLKSCVVFSCLFDWLRLVAFLDSPVRYRLANLNLLNSATASVPPLGGVCVVEWFGVVEYCFVDG